MQWKIGLESRTISSSVLSTQSGTTVLRWGLSHTHTHRLSVYNPIQSVLLNSHYPLPQTIFQIFPCLSELAEDEWLPLWKFESFVDFPMGAALPLKNPATVLCELQPGDWIQQDKGTHHMRAAEHWNHTTFVTLEHKTSLKSLGYICSNSQKYIVWVKMIDFSFMPKIMFHEDIL